MNDGCGVVNVLEVDRALLKLVVDDNAITTMQDVEVRQGNPDHPSKRYHPGDKIPWGSSCALPYLILSSQDSRGGHL